MGRGNARLEMEESIKIFFDNPKLLTTDNLSVLQGITGLYFIFTQNIDIQYPFEKSKLIYIGMSEKRTNSIKKRLSGHLDGINNVGLKNYGKVDTLFFTYLNFDILKDLWNLKIEDLETYFLHNFVKNYGVSPICNNKLNSAILRENLPIKLDIDWKYFK